jgi:hypothetical protein
VFLSTTKVGGIGVTQMTMTSKELTFEVQAYCLKNDGDLFCKDPNRNCYRCDTPDRCASVYLHGECVYDDSDLARCDRVCGHEGKCFSWSENLEWDGKLYKCDGCCNLVPHENLTSHIIVEQGDIGPGWLRDLCDQCVSDRANGKELPELREERN